MKKTSKKLSINRNTLRVLTELDRVVGGQPIDSIEVCQTGQCPSHTCTQGPRCITNVITRC